MKPGNLHGSLGSLRDASEQLPEKEEATWVRIHYQDQLHEEGHVVFLGYHFGYQQT